MSEWSFVILLIKIIFFALIILMCCSRRRKSKQPQQMVVVTQQTSGTLFSDLMKSMTARDVNSSTALHEFPFESLILVVFYRMANFDIRQNSNIRYRRIASILPEYQLFHQNTQFPTRIHNSLPEYQNKLPEYQDKINSFTILRITVFCILPLILQSDPSYQMLTWSLSLRHWLL